MVLLLRSSPCLLQKDIASLIQLKGCQRNAHVERRALPGYQNLLYRYEDQCETLAMYVNPLLSQKGHSIRALFCCRRCKQRRRTWSSSHVLAGHYVVNQKYVSLPAQKMKYMLCVFVQLLQDGACIHMCGDVAFSVYPLEYVLWRRSCWSCLHPPRLSYPWLTKYVHLLVVYLQCIKSQGTLKQLEELLR